MQVFVNEMSSNQDEIFAFNYHNAPVSSMSAGTASPGGLSLLAPSSSWSTSISSIYTHAWYVGALLVRRENNGGVIAFLQISCKLLLVTIANCNWSVSPNPVSCKLRVVGFHHQPHNDIKLAALLDQVSLSNQECEHTILSYIVY